MGIGKTRHWMHTLNFVVPLVVSIYFILDLEYPRQGLIRLEAFDQVLADMQQGIK